MPPRKRIHDVRAGTRLLPFSRRTCVMGILNVTPDSFSDGMRYLRPEAAEARAIAMAREGADIIDIGGESTRPGAAAVAPDVEAARVVPLIRRISRRVRVPISIDTRKASVAAAAMEAGAGIINDVSGLRHDEEMAHVAARYGAVVILMHMRGTPATMQRAPRYRDVVRDIIRELRRSVATARRAGVRGDRIIVDPGIGFGKSVRHNLAILNRLDELACLGCPVCVGVSRKSFLGVLAAKALPRERRIASVAADAAAIMQGASLIRVHDVADGRETAAVVDSIVRSRPVTARAGGR